MKEFKLQTRGSAVSKEEFPALISKLWDVSLKPNHCVSGFRGTGLFPYSREHVLKKMAPSAAEQVEKDSGDEEETEITCLSCGHHISATPILKRRIVGYFAGILEVQKGRPEVGKRNNLRIRVEGEAR